MRDVWRRLAEGISAARQDLGGREGDRAVVDGRRLVLVARVRGELVDDLAAPDLALVQGQVEVGRRDGVGRDRAGDDVAVGVLDLDRQLAVREVGPVGGVDADGRDRRDGDRGLDRGLRVVEHERRRLRAARLQLLALDLRRDREVELAGLDVGRRVAGVGEDRRRGAGEREGHEGDAAEARDELGALAEVLLLDGHGFPSIVKRSENRNVHITRS